MKNKTKILLVVTADILVFAIILLSFAWFHHVKPQKFDANHAFPLPEKRENLLHGKYEDKFTADGSIQKTENSYRSGNVSVEILSRDITVGGYPVHYYMADIYIKDISSLRSAVSEESDRRERVESLAAKHNAIVATSGDFFVFKQSGLEIRNGYVYRETINKTQDVCVIYQDGTMETILAGSVNLTAVYRKNRITLSLSARSCWTEGNPWRNSTQALRTGTLGVRSAITSRVTTVLLSLTAGRRGTPWGFQ